MTASESEPLLGRIKKRRNGTIGSRLFVYSVIGLLFIFAFGLTFLPRTSLSRDWRRIHNIRVSTPDVERGLFVAVQPDSLREFSKNYTKGPHLAGTGYDLVEWTDAKFKEFGLKSEIVSYDTYLSYPVDHSLSLLDENGTVEFEASLEEDVLKEDPTTGLPDRIPTFHGYGGSGNVTGRFVYANYGTKQDYDLLVEKGVDLNGTIVIARYGRNFRGLKVQYAEKLGAIGVVMYSDPADDGEVTPENGYKSYPEGYARNPSSVQRGSVQFLADQPGDPTTPGWPSHKDAKRSDPHDFTPKIPSIPISYLDAAPILKKLNGIGLSHKDLGENWKGSVKGVSYSVGPSKVDLNLYSEQTYEIKPIWNVIGKFDGFLPHEAIVIGNHRDAWIAGGAGDPNSGSAVLLEFAKALYDLKKIGYRPLRTIILASWDGEEYGLLGSTEYGEDKAKYISNNVLAYINLDVAVSGSHFSAGASPLLNDLLYNVTSRVRYRNNPDKTVLDQWKSDSGAKISTLGSGSDFTVFLDHLGVPSIDFGFTSGGKDPVYHYHSNYDSFHWIDTFGDPDWTLHATVTKILGLLVLSLSETEVIGFKALPYAELLTDVVNKFEKEFPQLLTNIEENAGLLQNNHHNTNDDRKPHDSDPSHVAKKLFKKLKHDIKKFKKASIKFDLYTDYLQDQFTRDYPWYKLPVKIAILVKIKIANAKLFTLERLFLNEEGLDNRPWFKHIAFAPGRYTGYSGDILTGLSEALEDGSLEGISKWNEIISKSVELVTKVLS